MPDNHTLNDHDTVLEKDPELIEPPMYAVVIHHDDYTPIEFVLAVLVTLFSKSRSDAEQIALKAQQDGKAVVEITTRDMAETKVMDATAFSEANEFPLKFSIRKE